MLRSGHGSYNLGDFHANQQPCSTPSVLPPAFSRTCLPRSTNSAPSLGIRSYILTPFRHSLSLVSNCSRPPTAPFSTRKYFSVHIFANFNSPSTPSFSIPTAVSLPQTPPPPSIHCHNEAHSYSLHRRPLGFSIPLCPVCAATAKTSVART
jgi:hypothetical protein